MIFTRGRSTTHRGLTFSFMVDEHRRGVDGEYWHMTIHIWRRWWCWENKLPTDYCYMKERTQ